MKSEADGRKDYQTFGCLRPRCRCTMVAHASPLAVLPMPDKPPSRTRPRSRAGRRACSTPRPRSAWFLWILVNVLGQVLLRTAPAAEGFDALRAVNLVSIAADALDIPLDLILIVIIGRIYRMQMDHLAAQD
jgi:hypothetical protein